MWYINVVETVKFRSAAEPSRELPSRLVLRPSTKSYTVHGYQWTQHSFNEHTKPYHAMTILGTSALQTIIRRKNSSFNKEETKDQHWKLSFIRIYQKNTYLFSFPEILMHKTVDNLSHSSETMKEPKFKIQKRHFRPERA